MNWDKSGTVRLTNNISARSCDVKYSYFKDYGE